jgi:Ca2+-binding RTX toxin-like protein
VRALTKSTTAPGTTTYASVHPLEFGQDPESGDEYVIYEVGNGGAGSDIVDGDSGDDEVFGSSGDDRIDAGSGNDRVSGDEGADLIRGGEGCDWISGDAGSSIAYGGSGGDVWQGAGNGPGDVDHFYGAAGDDLAEAGDPGRQFPVVTPGMTISGGMERMSPGAAGVMIT